MLFYKADELVHTTTITFIEMRDQTGSGDVVETRRRFRVKQQENTGEPNGLRTPADSMFVCGGDVLMCWT